MSDTATLLEMLYRPEPQPATRTQAAAWLASQEAAGLPPPPRLDREALAAAAAPHLTATHPSASSDQQLALPVHLTLAADTWGLWLTGCAAAGHSHTPQAAAQLALLRDWSLLPLPDLLRHHLTVSGGVVMPPTWTHGYARRGELNDAARASALLPLALGLLPERRAGERLGYSLAHAAALPAWNELLRCVLPTFDMQASTLQHWWVLASSAASPALGSQQIQRGVRLYLLALQLWRRGLDTAMAAATDLRAQVAALFRRKAPYAHGHHGRVRLGGRALDSWFGADPFPAEEFLDALLDSPYLNLRTPERSALLDRLSTFGGPMFGVFTAWERRLLLQWLRSEADGIGRPPTAPPPQVQPPSLPEPAPAAAARPGGGLRGCFHRLLRVEDDEATHQMARRIADRVLWLSRWRRGALPLPRYDPVALSNWLDRSHHAAVAAYTPLEGAPSLRRAEYVHAILQFAPAILVDGAWLQHVADAGLHRRPHARRLFRIYLDELGDGQVQQNHPRIYLDLLQTLGFALPPLDSVEFSRLPELHGAAFLLPCYLLAIARFPQSLQPELLGLNLAIERSGLGKPYRSLMDELRYWGIDPHIVSLHLGIDNLACGHAALARDALIAYLDGIRSNGGEPAVQRTWQRVRSGHASLTTAALPLLTRLAAGILWQRAARRLHPAQRGKPANG